MKTCIVIGKTNVGKTLFAVNFAEYLGMKKIEVTFRHPDGRVTKASLTPQEAMKTLVSDKPHRTDCLQCMTVQLPVGKGVKAFSLVDTSGLVEGIHSQAEIRRSMAQTLATVRDAQMVLHVVDAAEAGKLDPKSAFGDVDFQVAQFAQLRGAYLLLANKMDQPEATLGLERIKGEFPGLSVVAISALHKQGFKEVRQIVWRWL